MQLECVQQVVPYGPTQLYILVAITVATLAWLVRPSDVEQLEGSMVCVVGLLLVLQVAHVLFYVHVPLQANYIMHGVSWAGYIIMATMLFSRAWMRYVSRPPDLPEDDSV